MRFCFFLLDATSSYTQSNEYTKILWIFNNEINKWWVLVWMIEWDWAVEIAFPSLVIRYSVFVCAEAIQKHLMKHTPKIFATVSNENSKYFLYNTLAVNPNTPSWTIQMKCPIQIDLFGIGNYAQGKYSLIQPISCSPSC